MAPAFTLRPTGAFSLREAASFGFGPGQDAPEATEARLRLAFCCDDLEHLAGVALHQDGGGAVHGEVTSPDGAPDVDAVAAQVARVLSLDHDGAGFDALGARDPVLGALQAERPGLRPVLFHSPYEAAAWAVLSARRSAAQGAAVRRRLSEALGARLVLDGEALAAFPTPSRLREVEPGPGLEPRRVERLHAVAAAALEGRLDAADLRALEPAEATSRLLELPGIGPFYASLVLLRAVGHADLPVDGEPRTLAAVGALYGLGGPATPERYHAIAEGWRPYRTWASVVVHAAGRRAGVRP